jgi:hypothetical protein
VTAEIAVMNEEAIALAADSAVSGPKIFTSANKIFALSKYHPVGVMVFGNGQFLNVPWETVIKQYRRELGDESFPTLSEHAEHFLAFFSGKNRLFPEDAQERSVASVSKAVFTAVLEDVVQRLTQSKLTGSDPTEDDVTRETEVAIADQLARWKHAGIRSDLPKTYEEVLRKKYSAQIDAEMDRMFQDAPLSKKTLKELRQLTPAYLTSKGFLSRSDHQSGIVIAGFGSRDVFPRLRRFSLQGIAANRMKFGEYEPVEIGHSNRAVVSSFAQDDEVVSFMEGASPPIRKYLREWWMPKLLELVNEVGNTLELSTEKRTKLLSDMSTRCFEIVTNDFENSLTKFQFDKSITPIINIVEMLPKDELAAMAESLVNLTSFKRRVTAERETVGGPIDVAVISRGDGFIWIKRKHYFSTDLNPQFLANYYREEDEHDKAA